MRTNIMKMGEGEGKMGYRKEEDRSAEDDRRRSGRRRMNVKGGK